MSNFDNTNSGALFKNDRRHSDKSPNARGPAEVKCPCCQQVSKFWVSAWVKVSKSGDRFQSLAFTPDDPSASRPSQEEVNKALDNQYDDDIPF